MEKTNATTDTTGEEQKCDDGMTHNAGDNNRKNENGCPMRSINPTEAKKRRSTALPSDTTPKGKAQDKITSGDETSYSLDIPDKKRSRQTSLSSSSSSGKPQTRVTSMKSSSRASLNSRSESNTNSKNSIKSNSDDSNNCTSLAFLCLSKSWTAAKHRALSHPHESEYGCTSSARTSSALLPLQSLQTTTNKNPQNKSQPQHSSPPQSNDWNTNNSNDINISSTTAFNTMASSPLALACRYGAPSDTIQAILHASPIMVRRCIPNRGTPLHEAIMMCRHFSSAPSSIATVPQSVSLETNRGKTRGSPSSSQIKSPNSCKIPIERQQEMEYVNIIRMLLEADEELENVKRTSGATAQSLQATQKRATLVQDVDGNVPLHLLVRQAFYNYVENSINDDTSQTPQLLHSNGDKDDGFDKKKKSGGKEQQQHEHPILCIIRLLIESSPETVAIPDFTEYEETPLILALKSSMFANNAQTSPFQQQDQKGRRQASAKLEKEIFNICKLMLNYHPKAASVVVAKSGYTAVHSAVFHGRCSDTIRLLLEADAKNTKLNGNYCCEKQHWEQINNVAKCKSGIDVTSHKSMIKQQTIGSHTTAQDNDTTITTIPAAMRANSFGELPLHFAAMRGECTRSLALLSQAAPEAVLKRDVKLGMTPLHWLWVRFLDAMMERFHGGTLAMSEVLEQARVEMSMEEKNESLSDEKLREEEAQNGNISLQKNSLDDTGMDNDNSNAETKSIGQYPFSGAHQKKCSFPIHPARADYTPQPSKAMAAPTVPNSYEDENHFDHEYHMRTQAIDPPVDFYHMRHIPPKDKTNEYVLCIYLLHVLHRVKRRHTNIMEAMKTAHEHSTSCTETSTISMSTPSMTSAKDVCVPPATIAKCPFVFDSYPIGSTLIGFSEEVILLEQVISLFWAKATSLLHAAAAAQQIIVEEKEGDTNRRTTLQQTSLLDASAQNVSEEKVYLLHKACAVPCTPLSIAFLCFGLYKEQITLQDRDGKLPLHHIASRVVDPSEYRKFEENTYEYSEEDEDVPTIYPQDDVDNIHATHEDDEGNIHTYQRDEGNASENEMFLDFSVDTRDAFQIQSPISSSLTPPNSVTTNETAAILKFILDNSPPEAAKTYDNKKRLPLHCAIETHFHPQALHHSIPPADDQSKESFSSMHQYEYIINFLLRPIIQKFPDALTRRDGKSGLYPFMQVAAVASAGNDYEDNDDTVVVSTIYFLLHENPHLVSLHLNE